MGEIILVVLELCEFFLHRLAHRGKRPIHADDHVGANRTGSIRFCVEKVRGRFVRIDVGALMIEMHSDVRITLRRFDHDRVERRATDRVDVFVWIDIVRREMQVAGFVVDHASAHRDGVSQHFVGDADPLERVNPARREREIDRPPADNITFARIGPSLVKIDIISATPQIRGEQSSG